MAKARLGRIVASARESDVTSQDLVLSSMREAIITGALPPGTRLRQEKLAELFGTSRIPVRDALRALEYEGLVSSEPYRGFAVTQLDADDIEEVYDLRILLESHAVRLAVPLITDEDLRALEELYAEMTGAAAGEAQLAARERFYMRLYSITGRPRLVRLISRLRQEVARSLRYPTLQHAPEHHATFFDAIRAGDADRAVSQLSSHYRRVAILIRRYLRGDAMPGARANGGKAHAARG
ncbi:MAG TPA: GntR family transcriptional regulator [Candidatus Limnocylindria bacterium]|nr:GntR family transcriptional regulator [Candidatus Limnocylindria bacterium]